MDQTNELIKLQYPEQAMCQWGNAFYELKRFQFSAVKVSMFEDQTWTYCRSLATLYRDLAKPAGQNMLNFDGIKI